MPVMYASAGNCHVFVDATADLDDAAAITVNAKVQRPRSATRRRPCSCTPTPPAEFLPRVLRELRESGVELRVDGRARVARGRPRRLARRGHRGGLGHRVPRADPRREGRGLGGGGGRAREPLRLGPLGGDRHGLDRVGARVHRGRGRRGGLRERLDPLHRRRRVRHGRRDRQLHPEAARPRPDRRCASSPPTST